MNKNPLVFFGIIGIVAGFVLGRVIEGADANQFLTYGLIGGLVVGFLLDSRRKSSTSNPDTSTKVEPYKIPTVDELVDDVKSESSTGRSRVSRVEDESDVITRAREEIARHSGDSAADVAEAVDVSTESPESTGRSRVSRVEDETDLIARAREEIARNLGNSNGDKDN